MATKQELEARVIELEAQLAAAGGPPDTTELDALKVENAGLRDSLAAAATELKEAYDKGVAAGKATAPKVAAEEVEFEGTLKEASEKLKNGWLLWDHRVKVLK